MERKLIQKNEEIRKFYEENLSAELIKKEKEIITEMKELFLKYENNFKLIQENSIYDNIKLYSFSSRVKDSKSLFEKLFRNNININLSDNIEENKKKLIDIGDLIGVKISTTLRCDCENVYELIKKHLKEINMELILKAGEKIPNDMKNGRKIYKMNILYEDIKFELQIKSNIDSSWSDIEHSLFYKDYDYTEVKTNNHQVMLNIGKILDILEETMKTIRESKTIYDKNEREKYKMFDKVNELFSKKLQNLYGISFQISSLIPLILYLVEKNKDKIDMNITEEKIVLYKFFDDKSKCNKKINLEKVIFKEIDTRIPFHIFSNFYNGNDSLEVFFEQLLNYMFGLCKIELFNSEIYIKCELAKDILEIFSENLIKREEFFNRKNLCEFFEKIGEINDKLEKNINDKDIDSDTLERLLDNYEDKSNNILEEDEDVIEEKKEILLKKIRKDIIKSYFNDKKYYKCEILNIEINF